ncbi:MAG: hypothetical protein IKB86_05970 [Clostridia bacterium]|nr:hypothetical protein [Clostridia bacterium]
MKHLRKLLSVLLVLATLFSVSAITTSVYADSKMSEEFKKGLTNGKLVLNFAKPTGNDDAYVGMLADLFEDTANSYYLHDSNGKPAFSKDLSKVDASLGDEEHTVDVVWNYDKNVQKKAQEIVKKIPKSFYLKDLEFISYLYHNKADAERPDEMGNYSSELKEAIGNVNFSIKFDTRAGADMPFSKQRLGFSMLNHRDTTYHIWGPYDNSEIFVYANHVIYVPENTPDNKNALINAAQKRIDDYLGKNAATVSFSGETVAQYYESQIAELRSQLAAIKQKNAEYQAIIDAEKAKDPAIQDTSLISDLETKIFLSGSDISNYENSIEGFIDESASVDKDYPFMKDAVGRFIFNVKFAGKNETHKFVIIKDDSKLSVPSYNNVDINTNVSVSTDSSEVPLDAVIRVDRISNGKEHDRICGVLKINDNEMFDIELFSGSIDDYITKLKNGKFKVQLPIPKEYKGRELVVYYVDANGKVTAYNVTVKNGFAVFETDHFSIYTLTAKSAGATTPDTPDNDSTPIAPDNDSATPIAPDNDSATPNSDGAQNNSSVPKDDNTPSNESNGNIILWITLPIAVVVIAAGVAFIVIRKKKSNN